MRDLPPEMLPAFLAERDVECPECGDELVLRVGLADPGHPAGMTGLIGLAAGAGLSGLLLGYMVIRWMVYGQSFGNHAVKFLSLNVGGLLIEGGALALWLWNWRRTRRLDTAVKWPLAGACWALTLVNLVVFSLNVK